MLYSSEHVTHLHGSVEASNRRVDEASDNSVQDERQNLRKRRFFFLIFTSRSGHSSLVFSEKWLSSLINTIQYK